MGKRCDKFDRIGKDFYPTPYEAVLPVLPFLKGEAFIEPCAGDGALIRHLEKHGLRCCGAFDIDPRCLGIRNCDARNVIPLSSVDFVITNPPWSRPDLHSIINHFAQFPDVPTWLLFDADWMHTRQAAPYRQFVRQVVSVGRVKWIKDSPHTGKDNAAWYEIGPASYAPTLFHFRQERAQEAP